jgi:hypothetical protein
MTKTTMHDQLRIDTAKMLQIVDLKTMTAAQEVRLARATVLRLELDDLETRKINNDQHQPFDVKAYVAASEALERLVGGDPEQPSSEHDFSDAREELRTFLIDRAHAIEAREVRESERLRDENTRLRAMLNIPQPAAGDARSEGDAPSSSSSLPAAPPDNVVPIKRPETDVERMARVNSTPANPPPLGPREAWRDYVDDCRAVVSAARVI